MTFVRVFYAEFECEVGLKSADKDVIGMLRKRVTVYKLETVHDKQSSDL